MSTRSLAAGSTSRARLHYATFGDQEALLSAARACREQDLLVVDAFTPYPVHGLDEVIGIRRSRLPRVTFIAGAAGLALALWFQYWASDTSWPLNVGGKPFDSLPAFVPVAFEMLVLLAGLATAAAFLFRSRLRPGEPEGLERARVTDDRFVLAVELSDAALPEGALDALWRQFGAVDSWSEVT